MRAIDFLVDKFGLNKTEIILEQKAEKQLIYALAIEDFAIQVAVNLIAGLISKCKFKTMVNGKETEGHEYYLWNYEPNGNQSGADFKRELISKLIYHNEALVIENSKQLIIADDFYREPKALYPNKYTSVSRYDFTFNKTFYEKDVMYFKYSNKDMRGLLSNLMQGYTELINQSMKKYKRAGGRKGIMDSSMNPSNNEDWNKALNDLYGNRFKSYFNEENALVVLPKGMKYTEIQASGSQKSTSDVTDIINLTNEAFAKVGQAVKIPSTLMLGNVANLDSALDEAITTGITPVVEIIESEINRKRYGEIGILNGYSVKIDTTAIKHFDLMDVAGTLNNLLGTGLYSIDGLLKKLGETPLNTWWSKQHYMTLNNAFVENIANQKESKGNTGE